MLTYMIIYLIRDCIENDLNWNSFIECFADIFGMIILTFALFISIPLDLICLPFYLIAAIVYYLRKRKKD